MSCSEYKCAIDNTPFVNKCLEKKSCLDNQTMLPDIIPTLKPTPMPSVAITDDKSCSCGGSSKDRCGKKTTQPCENYSQFQRDMDTYRYDMIKDYLNRTKNY